MPTNLAYRIDIDNTITQPLYYEPDIRACIHAYLQAGIVTPEEMALIQYHPQLYSLPHVAITHHPLPDVVNTLQALAEQGASIQYVTLRNSFDSQVCVRIHENTHAWLKKHQFPSPMEVRFFWNLAEKLEYALDASEQQVLLIDDRPGQLLQTYHKLAERTPKLAREIKERVILVAFWLTEADLVSLPAIPDAPKVLPLAAWSQFGELLSQLGQEATMAEDHIYSQASHESKMGEHLE